MSYPSLRRLVPAWLRHEIFHFEATIEAALKAYAASLPEGLRVLDAGAGEGRYREYFTRQQYTGVDLGVGDRGWDYSGLDCVANLLQLPFRHSSFDAFVSVVTLEHVTDPGAAIAEMARVARPGATLFLVVPHEWEVHQHPHDYFRFTRYGAAYLLEQAGFEPLEYIPIGGLWARVGLTMIAGLNRVNRGPTRVLTEIPVRILYALIQLLCEALDRLCFDPREVLSHLVVARRRA